MKRANMSIREKFDTGISPPAFSKVKKQFQLDQATNEAVPTDTEEQLAPTPIETALETSASKARDESEAGSEENSKKEPQEESSNIKEDDSSHSAETDEPSAEATELPPVNLVECSWELSGVEADSVHVAGSFNRWNKNEFELRPDKQGVWRGTFQMAEGYHTYKFVIDVSYWHLDFEREIVIDKTGVSHPITIGRPIEAAKVDA